MLVGLARSLAIVDQAAEIILWLHLCQDQGWEDSDLEDDKDSILQAGPRVIEFQEHQACEQCDGDVVEDACEAVIWTPPETYMLPLLHDFDLMPEGRGIFFGFPFGLGTDFLASISLDGYYFFLYRDEFVRISPNLSPVCIANSRSHASSNCVEHPEYNESAYHGMW